jgi:tetratricopeptide (TPR) repeat protein
MDNFQRDLELCEELGDKQGTAIALGLIGELHSIEGHFTKAIEYLQKNLMLCEELGYQKGIAKALNTLGDVFYLMEQYDRSLHYYNRAIEVTRRINNKLVLGSSLAEKGLVLLATNKLAELEKVVEEVLELAEELGNPDLLFEAQLLAAKQQHAHDDIEGSMRALKRLLESTDEESNLAAIYYELWAIQPNNKEHREKALQLYEKLYGSTPKFIYRSRLDELRG